MGWKFLQSFSFFVYWQYPELKSEHFLTSLWDILTLYIWVSNFCCGAQFRGPFTLEFCTAPEMFVKYGPQFCFVVRNSSKTPIIKKNWTINKQKMVNFQDSSLIFTRYFYHGLLPVRQSQGHGAPCFFGVTSQFWRGRIWRAMGQCRVGPCLFCLGWREDDFRIFLEPKYLRGAFI